MAEIKNIVGRQVFDSRGNPTVEAEIFSNNGNKINAIVPSGASTGTHEAHELRDTDPTDYLGKGVQKAVKNINEKISKALKGFNLFDQKIIDEKLISLDGTEQKINLGANSILAVSMAACKLAAIEKKIPLYKSLSKTNKFTLPIPLLNIINGGVHANNGLEIQEFMIRPENVVNFKEAIRRSYLVIQNLKKRLTIQMLEMRRICSDINDNEKAINLIIESIENAGFKPGKDVSICLDVAANELKKPIFRILFQLINDFPITSIEDPFGEDEWDRWKELTKNENIQIVGDDLFATNLKRLKKGIKEKSANAILIKLNQIGTVTETMEVVDYAHKNNLKTIISHRSGDTEDTFIADLAVATNSSQIKTGSLARSKEYLNITDY